MSTNSTPRLRFFVPGTPVPKGRPRMGKNSSGERVVYTPKKTAQWEKVVSQAAWAFRTWRPPTGYRGQIITKEDTFVRIGSWREPREEPMGMNLDFCFLAPKGWDWKTNPIPLKYDVDNLAKAVMDALNGVLYKDDRQIYSLGARKSWVTHPSDEGVDIHLDCDP